jgi:hypothetical protein
LLTSETIARWVATKLAEMGILDDETVAEVQRHQEQDSKHILVPRDYSVADAIELFDEHLQKGNNLDAILITNSGLATEQLLGIATVADIPKMLSVLNG